PHVVLLDALGEPHLVLARQQPDAADRAEIEPHGVLRSLLRGRDRNAGGDNAALVVEVVWGLRVVGTLVAQLGGLEVLGLLPVPCRQPVLVCLHAVWPITASSSRRTSCFAPASES